jgi:hypothetical protein
VLKTFADTRVALRVKSAPSIRYVDYNCRSQRPLACWDSGFDSRRRHRNVSCECRTLSRSGLCVGLITRPEESYRVWCVRVWSWSLDNEVALAHCGLLRYGERNVAYIYYGPTASRHTDVSDNTATFTIAHIGLLENIHCQTAKQNSIVYAVTYIKWSSIFKTSLHLPEEQPQILAGSVVRHCSSEGTWITGTSAGTTNVKIMQCHYSHRPQTFRHFVVLQSAIH